MLQKQQKKGILLHMESAEKNRTIAALSTVPGVAAIAAVRLSGERAYELAAGVFEPFKRGKKNPNYMTYGELNAGGIKDEIMAVYYRAPRSYTGEDMVEFYTHGSPAVVSALLNALFHLGAKQAEAGEFTKRALLNGKLDLTRAEGVIDLINAETDAEAKGAFSLLCGTLKQEIDGLYQRIATLAARLEVVIDYPEEDLDAETEACGEELSFIIAATEKLKESYGAARVFRDGVRVTLTGKPNAGKSSLYNALLGRERAIVTDEAGTTRDTLEDSYEYKGVRFTLVDTAGIREAAGKAEKEGIERAHAAVTSADAVLRVVVAGESCEGDDGGTLVVENKIDLFSPKNKDAAKVSAKTGEGVEQLKELIYKRTVLSPAPSGAFINNARQLSAASEALSLLVVAATALSSGMSEAAATELNGALRALGRITGRDATDAVIDEVFSRFCVGK